MHLTGVILLGVFASLASCSFSTVDILRDDIDDAASLDKRVVFPETKVAADTIEAELRELQEIEKRKHSGGDIIPIMPIQDCLANRADVIFVIDSSGSIGKKDFKKVLAFVGSIISAMDVSSKKIRIGIITYSNTATVHVPLTSGKSPKEIIDKLSRLKFKSGGTNTADAILKMRQMFQNSGRKNAKKLGVLITDGRSKSPDSTREQAFLAKASCIKMVAVGVGKKVSENELLDVASTPVDDHVFRTKNCDGLSDILKVISKVICKDLDPPDSITNPVCTGQRTDLVLVVDKSGSIGSPNFATLKAFLVSVVDQLDVTSNKTHVAVLSFSTNTKVEFPLNKYTQKSDVIKAINAVAYTGGTTYTDRALTRLKSMYTPAEGGRNDVTKLAIVITDGRSTLPGNTVAAAVSAKAAGIVLLAVGITSRVNKQELNEIASDPDSGSVFTVNDFKDLANITRALGTKTCEAAGEDEDKRHKKGKSYHCSFDTNDVCGYRQEAMGKIPWKWIPNKNGPCGPDHTTGQKKGKYIYLDARYNCRCSSKDAYRRLWSPVYDASPIGRCLVFYYHMYGKTMGKLTVYISYKGSDKLWPIWTKSGNQKNVWHRAEIDLKTDKDFQLVFEGIKGGKQSNMALDDITVGYGSCAYVGKQVCG